MKRLFPLPVLLLMTVLAGYGQGGYKIYGSAEEPYLEGRTVYLVPKNDFNNIKDSTTVKDGKFEFRGIQEQPELHYLRYPFEEPDPWMGDYDNYLFILENAELKAVAGKSPAVTGTPENDELTRYHKRNAEILLVYNEQRRKMEEAETEEQKRTIQREAKIIHQNYTAEIVGFIIANNNNLVGLHVFNSHWQWFSFEDTERILEGGGKIFTKDPIVIEVMERQETLKKVGPGTMFSDFASLDTEGREVMLSDFAGKGKVVLVDFWASWCGPCIASVPEVKKAYDKYKGKGFEIVGVSLDSVKDKWTDAIDKYGMDWIHISDLKGWKTSGVDLYGVIAVPATVLIGKDGTILERNVNIDSLDHALRDLLK